MNFLSKNSEILRIAIPSIISNISVPLLGIVDIAITGHLGSQIYIGAISVGGTIFNMIYWIFNFLRFGTGSVTAQAFGRDNKEECALSLARSISICLGISLLLILFHTSILNIAMSVMEVGEMLKHNVEIYFNICIYGSVGFLGLFAFPGWYVGMQNTVIPLVVSISQNVINIIVSLTLVYGFEMGIEGVAIGTLTAQLSGFLLSALICVKKYRDVLSFIKLTKVFRAVEMSQFFKMNSAIFLRTLCVVAVTVYFTVAGTAFGDTILASNAVLMQFFMIFTFFTDGFAYAGEAVCGKYFGMGNNAMLKITIKQLFVYGIITAVAFTLVYIWFGFGIIKLLTDQELVVATAKEYQFWVCLIPVSSVGAFIWDGIYLGCGKVKPMLLCTFLGSSVFFITYALTNQYIGNNALWLGFILYLFVRGFVLRFSSNELGVCQLI